MGATPEGRIYMKPLAESRGQNAQLWVYIGGFEQNRQKYPSYDARLAHAISEEAWNDVIGQIKGYMNENALFKDSTKFVDPCCCCPPCTPCFCYVLIKAKKILDELNEIVAKASQVSHVKMWMELKPRDPAHGGEDRKDKSTHAIDQWGHVYGKLVPRAQKYQQEPKEYPGEDVYSRWVPDWPPPGYALVIEVPMSAETYFPIWCSEVPVQAPKQAEMDKPKEETV